MTDGIATLVLVTFCVLATSMLGACQSTSPERHILTSVTDTAAFREEPCRFRLLRARCGSMQVPQDHADPGGAVVRFPVVILAAADGQSAPPLVVLGGGGPGNSLGLDEESVSYHAELFRDAFLDRGHDVILMDQRGVGSADPSTSCPELIDLAERNFAEVPDETSEWQGIRVAAASCQRRLASEGVSLRHFDTVQSAADIEALRVTLGVQRWILYGVSYGGQLGLEVMRRHPDGVTAAILDSPATPQFRYYESAHEMTDDALERLFHACETDTQCRDRFPHLRANASHTLERLARSPVKVRLSHPYTGTAYEFVMDHRRLVDVLFFALYDPVNTARLPAALDGVHRDSTVLLVPHIAYYLSFQFDRLYGDGLLVATDCRDDISNTVSERVPDYRERFSGRSWRDQFRWAAQLCEDLQLGTAGAEVKLPVSSAISTLILSGQRDPVTPPESIGVLLDSLSNATLAIFPNESHHVLWSACAQLVVRGWLDDELPEAVMQCADAQQPLIETSL